MLIGYARVSSSDQNLDLQRDALQKIGCERIFEDKESGAVSKRSGLEEAMLILRAGDTLVVWRLDRLGRSLKHLIELMGILEERKIAFMSLQEDGLLSILTLSWTVSETWFRGPSSPFTTRRW